MRRFLIFILILVAGFLIYIGYTMFTTRSHSPTDIAKYQKGDAELFITYCQPYKKGRLIFGEKDKDALVPYGEKWRTGANEATEFHLNRDITIHGNTLASGKYSMYTIPRKDDWVVAFNSKIGYWGASPSGDPFEEDKDVLRVFVPTQMSDSVAEQFTIKFQEQDTAVSLLMTWDRTFISIPIELMP